MFDGTLGDRDTEPDDLGIKPGSKPFNIKYYLVLIINKEKISKEIKRLVKIGVSIKLQHSQYNTPVFIIPKKEGTVRFITYYRRLNRKLVRNPYPLPRIVETMQKLEVFKYATSLDLKMG